MRKQIVKPLGIRSEAIYVFLPVVVVVVISGTVIAARLRPNEKKVMQEY